MTNRSENPESLTLVRLPRSPMTRMTQTQLMSTMSAVVMLILSLSLSMSAPIASASELAVDDSLTRMSGKWKLDWKRSESFTPALKALEVPWILRQMAGMVSIVVTISVDPPDCDDCGPRVRIASKNPVKNTSRVVTLDGVARPFTDALGNDSMDQFSWTPELGMEMVRERTLDSGKSAKIFESRVVSADLLTMISTMTVWVEGEERASVRRVLSKVSP